jgi:hypothetical protein
MKKLWIAAVTMAMVLGVQAYGNDVKSVNVVGVMTVEVPAGADDGFTYALVSVPLTKLPVARGTIADNGINTITANNVNWGVDDFAVGADAGGANDEPGESTYYVEITSGVFEGRHFNIVENDSDTLILDVANMDDINPGDLNADPPVGFKIIPANRVRDVFGEPGNPSLVGGTSTETADTLQLWTGSTWGNHILHHNTAQRWVQLGGGGFADDRPIDRDEGILVRRLPDAEQVNITLAGEVSGNAQTIVLDPGYNLVGGALAVGRALDDPDSGLRDALQAGTSTESADTIQAWQSGTWGNHILLHSTPDRWVQLGGGGFVDDYVLDPTKSYLFHLKGPRTWQRVSPIPD